MMNKPYVIAEMGVNFYDTAKVLGISALDAAKLYIDKAAEVGINCAKFQSYKAGTIVSKNSPAYWDITKEPTKTQYELFLKHDRFGEAEYRELCNYTHAKGMDFTSTPFDYISADYLKDMVDFYKISSSDLSNLPFIRHIGKKGKPVFLSVGASYLSEVDVAIRALKESGCKDIVVLHCVLSYPTEAQNANLTVRSESLDCVKSKSFIRFFNLSANVMFTSSFLYSPLNHGAFVVLFLNPDPVFPGYFLTVQNPKFGFLITQGFKVLCRFLLCVEL